jgi:adenosine deaminase
MPMLTLQRFLAHRWSVGTIINQQNHIYATNKLSSLPMKLHLTLQYGLLSLLFFVGETAALAKPPQSPNSEQRAARVFESVRANPLTLHAFLVQMPKGADLHSHLSGAVYAETYIRQAAEEGGCVDVTKLALIASNSESCAGNTIPATDALKNQKLYDDLVNSLSMRNFIASSGVSGHDHFFASFDKFNGLDAAHSPEWLDEVASRAAAQNEQYLELMTTGKFERTKAIIKQLTWNNDFAALRTTILAQGLREDVAVYSNNITQYEQQRQQLEHCNAPYAAPACRVKIRYLYQILRGFPKEQVFAQALLGFEIASKDSRVVGVNLVMPEDSIISMRDYALQMRIIGFLHSVYPKVHISLHAGEIKAGDVPPSELCCHVRMAVEVAHAERIGHGVDVMYEQRPYELLKEMADKHVLIETNLTSNAVILGIEGAAHPFPIERKFGVPLALSTDDEGVSRIDLTHEFVRAVDTYHLKYSDLKQLVRASLEHSFLSGSSLWQSPDNFTRRVAACANDDAGATYPSSACADFLKSSEKAQEQWELEKRFRVFETNL